MTQPPSIRPLRQSDREGWLALWSEYLRFYRAELVPDTAEQTFSRLCEADGSVLGLLALDAQQRAVGLAHVVLHPTTWSKAPSCYLEDLFVAPAARGDGVALQLIEAVYALARGRGAGRVYWHTQQFNAPARSLYDTVASLMSWVVYEREL